MPRLLTGCLLKSKAAPGFEPAKKQFEPQQKGGRQSHIFRLKKQCFFYTIIYEPTGMLARGRRKPGLFGAKASLSKKQYFGVPFRTVMSPIIVSGGRCYKTG